MIRLVLLAIAFLLVATVLEAKPYRRRYRHSVDPNHAEEVLAGIALSPRLDREEWLDLLSYHRDETYVIRNGDTLWGIAGKTFGNPRLWRKLWQVNPVLTNPHELTTGQLLQFYREGAEGDELRIPLIKLVPSANGVAADLDADAVLHRDVKNQFRPRVFVIGEDELVGELTGSYGNKIRLGELDEMFVTLNNRAAPQEGQHFGIVKLIDRLKDSGPNGNTYIGWLVRLQGEIAITMRGQDAAKAELVKHFGIIERGDRLIAVPKPVTLAGAFNPPGDLKLRIVSGQEEDTKMFGQGQTVLLDKGSADGVRQGYMFRIYRDEDPVTESDEDVLPDSKGEVQIVYTSELSSVGYIVRNKDPLFIGDLLVPAQTFRDAPPPPQRRAEIIELD